MEAHRGKLPDDELAEKIRDAHCVGIRYERRDNDLNYLLFYLFFYGIILALKPDERRARAMAVVKERHQADEGAVGFGPTPAVRGLFLHRFRASGPPVRSVAWRTALPRLRADL